MPSSSSSSSSYGSSSSEGSSSSSYSFSGSLSSSGPPPSSDGSSPGSSISSSSGSPSGSGSGSDSDSASGSDSGSGNGSGSSPPLPPPPPPESCTPPDPFLKPVKGYILAVSSVRAIRGDFPPADPYIYCQNDPDYNLNAASAVSISMRVVGGGDSGTLEIGWTKSRFGGTTNIVKKIFVTAGIRSDVPSLDPIFVANMPANNFNLKIERDCSNGTPKFLLDGNDVTPTISTNVLNKLKAMTPTHVKTQVELHDDRSHAPGTDADRYVVLNCEYQKCTIIHPWLNALGDLQIDPGTPEEVKTNKASGETFECWDTRN